MKTLIPLVYENGVFRPEGPVDLPEGAHVDLLVDDSPEAVLREVRARFPKAFGEFPKENAEEIAAIIEEEFGMASIDDED